MDIEKAYEAMINDIFWDGKSVGVCLSLPIIVEINEVIAELDKVRQHILKLRYGLDGSEPLASSAIAKILGIQKSSVDLELAQTCKNFATKLIHEHGLDVSIFMMSRVELLNATYDAQLQLRRAKLKIDDLTRQLAEERKSTERLKYEENLKKAGAPYNVALADIGLKSHTLDCLRRRGWTHIYDVAGKTERDLAMIYRFGDASLADLRECLAPYGITISR